LYVGCFRTVVDAAAVKLNAEYVSEGPSKLRAHGAVENKVDRAVYEDQNVPDVAQGYVDVVEDSLVDGTGQCQHALRQLGQDERQDYDDEHGRRTTVADVESYDDGRITIIVRLGSRLRRPG